MKIVVDASDFRRGAGEFKDSASRYDSVLDKHLKALGDAAVTKLKMDAYAGAFGRNRRGGPALIKTGVYINSYTSEVKSGVLGIGPTGMNAHMSNAALADILEYGNGSIRAYPHLRPLAEWIATKGVNDFGKAFAEDLLP